MHGTHLADEYTWYCACARVNVWYTWYRYCLPVWSMVNIDIAIFIAIYLGIHILQYSMVLQYYGIILWHHTGIGILLFPSVLDKMEIRKAIVCLPAPSSQHTRVWHTGTYTCTRSSGHSLSFISFCLVCDLPVHVYDLLE